MTWINDYQQRLVSERQQVELEIAALTDEHHRIQDDLDACVYLEAYLDRARAGDPTSLGLVAECCRRLGLTWRCEHTPDGIAIEVHPPTTTTNRAEAATVAAARRR